MLLEKSFSESICFIYGHFKPRANFFGGFIGPIKENFNWEITLFAFALILGLAWLVLQFLNIDTHKESVAALNKKDVENESLKVA